VYLRNGSKIINFEKVAVFVIEKQTPWKLYNVNQVIWIEWLSLIHSLRFSLSLWMRMNASVPDWKFGIILQWSDTSWIPHLNESFDR
jgi:hypothetical protein